jgi:formamidopyrimidine-DNA glycosylase
MPELPEVETIRNRLRLGGPEMPALAGRLITGACLLWERTLAVPSAQEFPQRIAGQTIRDIDRRGKFIIFRLSQDALLIHLRMSGDLLLRPASAGLAAHDRLVLELDAGPPSGNLRLAFNDTRKFGRAWLVEDPAQVLGSLGPEPLDASITAQTFHYMLRSRRRQLKPLLLDQTFLAGLGNIYTDESLHLAGLHPLRLSHSLEPVESGRLLESIQQVLLEASAARVPASIGFTAAATSRIICGCTGAREKPAPPAACRSSASWSASAAPISARTVKN